MVDPERVHDRLDRLEVEVTRLRQLAEQDTQRLVDESHLQYAAQRGLEIAIQICLDVGQHLIASEDLRTPQVVR